jgi:hypothetical protein
MSEINYKELAQELLASYKTASSTPNVTLGHGPGGAFSTPGVNRQVFNAGILPALGLAPALPIRSSIDVNPLHMILTGVTAVSGSHPAGDCDPCKIPGNLKRGIVKSTFGRFCLSTPTVNLSDIGSVNNRGEFKDFQLVGDPFNGVGSRTSPTLPASGANPLNSEVAKIMFQFRAGWVREFSKQLYTGNPANNSGSYKEFRGLDILVNTGYQDAETGAIMPAADALVRNINLNMASNGTTYVNEMTAALRRLKMTASQTGLDPVRFAFVMSEMAFYELTAIWPCSYQSYRCVANANGATVNLEATDMRNMVETMRAGKFLLLDGAQVPVILDDAIAQTDSNGEFTSSIYLLPLTVAGGIPSLYVEHFDFDNGDAAEARNAFATPGKILTTDGGRFLWTRRENGFCFSMDAVERSRVILETPFLSARFTNVKYTPLIQTKSGYTTDTSRFYNGGSTSITAPSFYAPTVYSN